jgi:glycosyltransferase involved in cell wall biosynthesis
MNVTVVVGGRWHGFDLAAELHRAGILHRIVTNYPRFAVRRWGIPSERVISLPSTLIVGRALSKVSLRLAQRHQYRLHKWFASAAARHLSGSDLLVGWSSFSEPSIRWARDRNLPFVLERGSAHIVVQDALLSDEYKLLGLPWSGIDRNVIDMELREYELCTEVSVPSLFVERSFLSQGFPIERLFRNPYGVRVKNFCPPAHPPLPPTPDRLEVIYAGALSVQKGTHHLLNAFGRARRQSWQLTLVGTITPESRPWISQAGRGIYAVGHKPQGELPDWYGRAHCFVMPSIQEGLAMVQVQALACGLPLVCTTNTGGEDLLRLSGVDGWPCARGVTEFPAGFLLPIRDPDAIAQCLDRLAGEEGLWAAKREAALSIAKSSLGWQHYGDRAVRTYRRLFSNQRSS